MKGKNKFKEERISVKRRRIRDIEMLDEKIFHERFAEAGRKSEPGKLNHVHAE